MWRENLARNLRFQKIQRTKSRLNVGISRKKQDKVNSVQIELCKGEQQQSTNIVKEISSHQQNSEVAQALQLRKICSQLKLVQKKEFQLQTKDFLQSKKGDLLELRKIKQKEIAYNLQQPNFIDFKSKSSTSTLDQSEKDVDENPQNAYTQNNLKNKEVLRVRNFRNLTCRPIKNTQSIFFDKKNSSILLKRSKSAIQRSKTLLNQQNLNKRQQNQLCNYFNQEKIPLKYNFKSKDQTEPSYRKIKTFPSQLEIIREESKSFIKSILEIGTISKTNSAISLQSEQDKTEEKGNEAQDLKLE